MTILKILPLIASLLKVWFTYQEIKKKYLNNIKQQSM